MSDYPKTFDAIKVTQPLGEFFVIALPARLLRQIVYLDPTRISAVDRTSFLYNLLGNQRDASLPRARKIGEFINTMESAFPNSVILAANYIQNGEFQEDGNIRWTVQQDQGRYTLTIPTDRKMASIVDGQHRLLGFDYCIEERRDMELLCAVYMDLPQVYQAYLFATINFNQKKVDKSLAYEQFGYNLDDEKKSGWAPDKLAVFFTRKLNLNPQSPLYHHIKIAPLEADLVFPQDGELSWMVSTACIVEGIISLFSSRPTADRDLLHSKSSGERNRSYLTQDGSPLRPLYLKSEDDKIWELLVEFLKSVSSNLWAHASNSSYIRKTIGIQASFDVFRVIALRTSIEQLTVEIGRVFKSANRVDFSSQFFQASGKGRVRVKNVILWLAGMISDADLSEQDRENYLTLLHSLPSETVT